MDEQTQLAEQFEANRPHLRSVAYRMLGSVAEADDAVQEGWLRVSRSGAHGVENLGGWLTTIVGRVCLDMLRSRKARREDSLDVRVPDPVVALADGGNPEHEALLAESVGLALLIVLETLEPAERLAFVLHDMFAVPFDEIARIIDRSPTAARQLASRARRRVQRTAPVADGSLAEQRVVVDAFLSASRAGDFEALVAVLHPDIVLRADTGGAVGGGSRLVRGAAAVAGQALLFSRLAHSAMPAVVNGAVGVLAVVDGRLVSVTGLTISGGKIVEMDILADPNRLRQLGVAVCAA
jgi:RNA polymerase sigma factor (sigma-70 family)